MKILRLLVAVSLLGVSSIAAADPQDYTNIEVFLGRQGNIFLDGGTAYRVAGSYDLSDTFYVFGQYSNNTLGDFANSSSGLDAKQYTYGGGLGMHFPVADASDYVIRFSLNHNEANTDFTTSTHNGYDLGTGFNTAITTGFELSAFIDHTTAGTDATTGIPQNVSASSGETILSTAIHTQVSKSLDFGITAEYSSIGQNRFLLSFRYNF